MEDYLKFEHRAHLIRITLFNLYVLGCDDSIWNISLELSDALTTRFDSRYRR